MSIGSIWYVLKWVLAALAAGFIGQFGRVLATRLIERHRRRKGHLPKESNGKMTPSRSTEDSVEQQRVKTVQKIEKKRIKTELKKAKKKQRNNSR